MGLLTSELKRMKMMRSLKKRRRKKKKKKRRKERKRRKKKRKKKKKNNKIMPRPCVQNQLTNADQHSMILFYFFEVQTIVILPSYISLFSCFLQPISKFDQQLFTISVPPI